MGAWKWGGRLAPTARKVCAGALALLLAPCASAQVEMAKLVADDAAAIDFFGQSVGVSGDIIVVGSIFDDDLGAASGSAYVFARNEGGTNAWGQLIKLLPEMGQGAAGDRFGESVAIDNDVIVVGAPRDDTAAMDAGAAYVFERDAGGPDAWGQVAKITAFDGFAGDFFGESVAVSGEIIVVGARRRDSAGSDAGAAYIYRRNQGGPGAWGLQRLVTAPDAAPGDMFGASVGVTVGAGGPIPDAVIVGAPGRDDAGADSGAVYFFHRNQAGPDNWGFSRKSVPPELLPGDAFGGAVSIDRSYALVGARLDDEKALNAGAAYVLKLNQGGVSLWGSVAKLVDDNGAANDGFGRSVCINANLAIVGANQDDDAGTASGSAFVFGRTVGGSDGWGRVAQLIASDAAEFDEFGISVGVGGFVGVVGAYAEDAAGAFDSGSAYAFDVLSLALSELLGDCNGNSVSDLIEVLINGSAPDCNDNGIPDACDIAQGDSLDANGDGVPDECQPNCPGDFNLDGVVDSADFFDFIAAFINAC